MVMVLSIFQTFTSVCLQRWLFFAARMSNNLFKLMVSDASVGFTIFSYDLINCAIITIFNSLKGFSRSVTLYLGLNVLLFCRISLEMRCLHPLRIWPG